jgi:ribose 5-phosphate isomerase B
MKIAIASDHAGFQLKSFIKERLAAEGHEFRDFGTNSEASMDYPDAVHPLAEAIESGDFQYGIVICGSGNGVAITANKYNGIRAALCWNDEIVRLARLHNNANVLALPARYIDKEDGLRLSRFFLETPFEGGRHLIRVEKISKVITKSI